MSQHITMTMHNSNLTWQTLNISAADRSFDSFAERERFILENLIRKALVSKVMQGRTVMVRANESR